jgi:hypothetical protein
MIILGLPGNAGQELTLNDGRTEASGATMASSSWACDRFAHGDD